MKVLVLGATGATGRLVVQQLIDRNIESKIVVRRVTGELKEMITNGQLECIIGSISEFGRNDFENILGDCEAVISCLGHNLSLKGILGKPRLLVTDCIKNICDAVVRKNNGKVKVILMNTTANRNIRTNEIYSLRDRAVLSILSIVLPPHKDNVRAATYLSQNIGGNNSCIEWIVVRPDTLIDEKEVGEYEIIESPKRSPVFDSGKTSRINVAHFMVELLLNEKLWKTWKYKMPVIYNNEKLVSCEQI